MSDRLRLLEGLGVELEYMIVDRKTLSVRPLSDEVLLAAAGQYVSEVERGELCWSNELAMHVIEFKTNGPVSSLDGLDAVFLKNVQEVNEILFELGAQLMPTAMHPWMDPHREMKLWPHEYSPIYESYNRIFDCRGHGWANLQSAHLNLSFSNDEEFGQLHAAIRMLLPIMPALAASSPILDGQISDWLDARLEVYRHNSDRIPSVTGRVIPEAVFTQADYDAEIFQPMFRDIAPYDPECLLQDEFLNSRGAIARFGRGSIEIRVLDVQECPAADLAIHAAIVEAIRTLIGERWCSLDDLKAMGNIPLEMIFLEVIRHGNAAVIDDLNYLHRFGLDMPVTAGDLWGHLLKGATGSAENPVVQNILDEGPLARRILNAISLEDREAAMRKVYGELCGCLQEGRFFAPK